MSVLLKAMNETSFSSYMKSAIPTFAQDNVDAGRWDEKDAFQRAEADFKRLLPEGLETIDNYLFDIIETVNTQKVGVIWVKVTDNIETKSAFIYDIEIEHQYRRNGYAKQALLAVEKVALDLEASTLGLHVFNFNSEAMALYRSTNYQVVSHNMQKQISR